MGREKDEGKASRGERNWWFLNTDRVPLSWSVHAGEIPACCWLLHYINSSFYSEPRNRRIEWKEEELDELG